jgi:hypothetical protein
MTCVCAGPLSVWCPLGEHLVPLRSSSPTSLKADAWSLEVIFADEPQGLLGSAGGTLGVI